MDQLLQIRKSEIRRYHTSSSYYSVIRDAHTRIACWYPGQLCGRPPMGTLHQVAASDFWVPGQGGHADLSKRWKIALPEDYLEFCSLFKTYTLVGRQAVTILDVKEIEEITLGLRDGDEVSPDDPYCLYRFAQVEGSPWHFMFRYSDDGVFQDIAFASYTDSGEWEILGENEAHYGSDPSFCVWLKRMIETDCVPLRHNFDDEFAESTQRIKPSA